MAHVREAAAVAHRHGDPDLRFCARGLRGRRSGPAGAHPEGMRRVDEAAAAATGGEVRDHLVIGEIYCKMLLCCELALDVRRAQQWMAVAESFGRRSHDLWVSAICRMHYGGILTAAGRWAEAEHQLSGAAEALRGRAARTAVRGRLPGWPTSGSARAGTGRRRISWPMPSSTARRRYRWPACTWRGGEAEAAAGVLRRSLAATAAPVLQAPALAVLVEAAAAGGGGTGARAAAGPARGPGGRDGPRARVRPGGVRRRRRPVEGRGGRRPAARRGRARGVRPGRSAGRPRVPGCPRRGS